MIFIGSSIFCYGQQKKLPPKPRKISIHSENNQVVDATTSPPTQFLNGDVKVFHSGTFMYCDTAILRGNFLRMRHNVVLMQNDTIRIFGDSLQYNGDSLVAYLYGNLILENGPTKKLYTTFIRYDVRNKIAYYNRNARMVDGNSTLESKQGRYDLNANTAYFYQNVQGRGENSFLVSDSLAYNTDTKRINFLAPTRIFQDTTQIYSQTGWFDTENEIGDFIGNAQYTSGKTIATSDTMSYNGKLDQVTLRSKDNLSKYFAEKDTAIARVIYYDRKNEDFRLEGDAYYHSAENEVKGKIVFYNKKEEKFKTIGRATVSDPPYLIDADTLDYDKARKYGQGHGDVIWRDTAAKNTIYADHVLYDQSITKMLAYNDIGRPSFENNENNDTLTLKADTLRSFQLIKERLILPTKKLTDREIRLQNAKKQKESAAAQDSISTNKSLDQLELLDVDSLGLMINGKVDSLKQTKNDTIITDTIYTGIMDTIVYLVGDNDVRMYKSDMQTICDSLVFNRSDSIIVLYGQPFVWSDSSQIHGDTIDVKMRNGKADQLIVRSNANIINTEDTQFFNQIKGNLVHAFFNDNSIDHMDVNGNSQIVYYLTDDSKAYMGVNTTESSSMTFYFLDKKVSEIKCYTSPNSKVIPMDDANHEKLKISGFNWNVKARPISSSDL
jgi:lipopolysaccharide export system protein LptA